MHCRTKTDDYLTPSTTSVSALSKDARAYIPHVNGSFPIIVYTSLLASVHSLMNTKQTPKRSVHEDETASIQDRKLRHISLSNADGSES
jgi:hypothetical protein